MDSFTALGLPQPLLQSLEKMTFTKPTPIQAAAIPLALAGRDILGSAQTGTGKTAAFAIPLLTRLLTNKQSTAIVLSPTRELAAQIMKEMQKLLSHTQQIKGALLIGGDSMSKQLHQLKQFPRLIVGTPGRINDHLQQGSLRLELCDFLVLDETDKMLDMGFEEQIDRVVRRLPKKRQTLMFSATLPPFIVKLAEKYLNNAERIAVGSAHMPIEKITQELVHLPQTEKYGVLLGHLSRRTGSVIIFVKTKRGADKLAKKLGVDKHSAEAIHGNLSQSRRTRVIEDFRRKNYRIMVATDVAARGLDIPHIEHVINYDLPQCPEDYIHRIGRTARAGAEGAAVCFITPEDREKWRDIHLLMNPGLRPVSGAGSQERQGQPNGGRRPSSEQRRGGKPGGSSRRRFGGNRGSEQRQGRSQGRSQDRSQPRAAY